VTYSSDIELFGFTCDHDLPVLGTVRITVLIAVGEAPRTACMVPCRLLPAIGPEGDDCEESDPPLQAERIATAAVRLIARVADFEILIEVCSFCCRSQGRRQQLKSVGLPL